MITAEVPLALAKDPLSPVLPSQLETIVPSGRRFTGKILPTESEAILINNKTKANLTLGTSVDILSSVHTFYCNEILSTMLVSVWVSEDDSCEGCSTAWVVNDFLDNSLGISI